jgi:peroxiredoxin
MTKLSAGQTAPAIELPFTQGGQFSLPETLRGTKVVVAAFFKVSCPTCQYAFPFLERLHQAYPGGGVRVAGISQNDAAATAEFVKTYGVTFPVALDDKKSYAASNAYGLTTVPSVFVIREDGQIEQCMVGWVREEFEQLNKRVAQLAGVPAATLIRPGEAVTEFKAG